ncbi:hypothetical protein [Halosimplex carlsbadense]|uniref:hypothetical protein n=1 Tax=Halosimplex carlsbadense TaxID=171164 RepID=UPI000678333C|nr:hypothetical protein [Halosimplex carlsbadense]
MSQKPAPKVELAADRVQVSELEITNSDVVEYLEEIEAEDREEAIQYALNVGVKTLQLAETSREEEFVERKFSEMHQEFETEIERIEDEVEERFGSDGDVPEIFQKHLGEDGKLQEHIEHAFSEDGPFVDRLDEELGEDGERIQEALDPDDEGTPTYRLKSALLDEIRSLRDKIEERETEEETREELKQETTLKGDDFEETVGNILGDVVRNTTDEVEPTGEELGERSDRKVGDFVLTLGDTGQRIVVEAKSATNYSQPKIKEELAEAIENRDADYALIVFECESYVPDKIGYFQEFDDDRLSVALSADEDDDVEPGFLRIAINWARARAVQSYVDAGADLEPEAIQNDIGEVEDAIGRFSRVRTKTTNIREAANEIDEELRSIQNDVEDRVGKVRAELQGASDS